MEYFIHDGKRFIPEFVQLLHDDQTRWKFRNGLPETYPLYHSHFVTLNKEWQEFWFRQFIRPGWTEKQLKNAWQGLIKDKVCFTDNHAPQNGYIDFITNPDADGSGIGHKTITTGGNVFKVKGTARFAGLDYYEVETLDGTLPPPDVTMASHPWLIHKAVTRTNITEPDGLRRCDPFPQLGGMDVPSLLISNGPNYIRAEWTRPVGGVSSPYHPVRS
jgi:hypothetical protein